MNARADLDGSRVVDVDGTRIHYRDVGHGPVLLFVHGAPAWSYTWRDVVGRLRDGFRCVALDLPGFGLSAPLPGAVRLRELAWHVRRFVETLDLEDAILVANDTGGAIGFRAACFVAERFRGFAAVDTFAFALDDFPVVRTMLRLVSSGPARAVNRRVNLLPRAVTSVGTPRRRWSASDRTAYLAPFASRAMRDRCIDVLGELARDKPYLADLQRALGAIVDRPLLGVFGAQDPVRAFGFPARFARLFPRYTEHVVAGARHFAHEDDPDDVAAAIRRWVATTFREPATARSAVGGGTTV